MNLADRVKGFIETWEKRKAGEIPEPARCGGCGNAILEGMGYDLLKSGLVCLKCKKSLQTSAKREIHESRG